MNKISDLIKCTKCKEILKMSVLIPCGHTICNHHVKDEVNRKFECFICQKNHEIPSDGFTINRALESLVETNIEKIDLGEEYKVSYR